MCRCPGSCRILPSAFRYTQWINQRQKRSGHLFQGRFKAVLVDADTYILELIRYIHLNPIRAHLVRAAEEYPWSSHRTYLGWENIPWLTIDWALSLFAADRKEARVAYMDFISQEREEGHGQAFHCGSVNDSRVLGDDKFIDSVLAHDETRTTSRISLETILLTVCHCYGISESELVSPGKYRKFSEARGVAAWLILDAGEVTLTALSHFLGRDVSTLSSAAKAINLRATNDHEFAKRLEKLKETLYSL